MSKRKNMQVAIEFHKVIEDIQKQVMQKEGRFVSTREITSKIKREDIEKLILANREDIALNLDRRKR